MISFEPLVKVLGVQTYSKVTVSLGYEDDTVHLFSRSVALPCKPVVIHTIHLLTETFT